MGELVNLGAFRAQRDAGRAYSRWQRRVGYTPQPGDRLAELPDEVLSRLAGLDHFATLAIYDVVLGVRGWGTGERYTSLEPRARLEALDAFLLIADALRFELMRRLGWVNPPAAHQHSLLELATRTRQLLSGEYGLPTLSQDYPAYADVQRRLTVEPEAVVRSLIPEALAAFRRRVPISPPPA